MAKPMETLDTAQALGEMILSSVQLAREAKTLRSNVAELTGQRETAKREVETLHAEIAVLTRNRDETRAAVEDAHTALADALVKRDETIRQYDADVAQARTITTGTIDQIERESRDIIAAKRDEARTEIDAIGARIAEAQQEYERVLAAIRNVHAQTGAVIGA